VAEKPQTRASDRAEPREGDALDPAVEQFLDWLTDAAFDEWLRDPDNSEKP
jgi:hypothetical protein